jgi:hypothetical protein
MSSEIDHLLMIGTKDLTADQLHTVALALQWVAQAPRLEPAVATWVDALSREVNKASHARQEADGEAQRRECLDTECGYRRTDVVHVDH